MKNIKVIIKPGDFVLFGEEDLHLQCNYTGSLTDI